MLASNRKTQCSRVIESGVGLDAPRKPSIQHAVRESGGNLSARRASCASTAPPPAHPSPEEANHGCLDYVERPG